MLNRNNDGLHYVKLEVPPLGYGMPQEEVVVDTTVYRHLSRGIYVPQSATPEDIGAAFDRWLEDGYEENAIWSYPLTRRILDICRYQGGVALDLGVGSGISAEALVDHGAPASNITGYDVSKGMLDAARKKSKLKGMKIVEGDMASTLIDREEAEDVELAISIFAFSNVPPQSWDVALGAIGKRLRSDGILALVEGTNPLSTRLALHMQKNYSAYDYEHQHSQENGRKVDIHFLFASKEQLLA